MLMNTGTHPITSSNGLITTVAWQIGDKVTYALEGSVFIAGAAIQWLRDGLGIIESSRESERMACSVSDTNGVYFVPAFTGLGAPYWDSDARGLICGLTRGTQKEHIVRAALEAMVYQTDDVLKIMMSDSGVPVTALKIDGGASANNFLSSFQANISGITVERPDCVETTALGAAYLAGLGCGMYASPEEITALENPKTIFRPAMSISERAFLRDGWHNAVNRAKSR